MEKLGLSLSLINDLREGIIVGKFAPGSKRVPNHQRHGHNEQRSQRGDKV